MRLLLFDIDGTLIRSHGAGRQAITAALMALYGTAGPIESYHMSGKTDPRIVTDLLTAAGFSREQIKQDMPEIFGQIKKEAERIFPNSDMVPCPGVLELLTRLNLREDVILGLLTGNLAETAPLKLAAAGLSPALFRVGAFGSDGMDRNQLPPVAMERAQALSDRTFTGNNTVVIGDTPADILCARAGKATAVAVASGWHSRETLAKYRPDYLLDDLAQIGVVTQILLGNQLPEGEDHA